MATPAPPVFDYTAGQRPLADALADMRAGLDRRRLAHELARRDVRNRYKGAAIGAFWITVTTGMTALGLGLLYGELFGLPIKQHLPYVAIGIVVWGVISGSVLEGSRAFLAGADMFKQMRMPISVFALRVLIRLAYVTGFRAIVLIPICAATIAPAPAGVALSLAGAAWIGFTGYWAALLLGVLTARFQDVGQMASAGLSFAFFVTPIIWRVDRLGEHAHWINWNPFYHYLEIVRAPLLGEGGLAAHYAVAVPLTCVLAILGTGFYAKFFRRLPYWC